jgi:hypothetical protein
MVNPLQAGQPTNFGDLTANHDIAQLPGTTAGTSAGTGHVGEIFQVGIPGGGAIPLTSGVATNVTGIALGTTKKTKIQFWPLILRFLLLIGNQETSEKDYRS